MQTGTTVTGAELRSILDKQLVYVSGIIIILPTKQAWPYIDCVCVCVMAVDNSETLEHLYLSQRAFIHHTLWTTNCCNITIYFRFPWWHTCIKLHFSLRCTCAHIHSMLLWKATTQKEVFLQHRSSLRVVHSCVYVHSVETDSTWSTYVVVEHTLYEVLQFLQSSVSLSLGRKLGC